MNEYSIYEIAVPSSWLNKSILKVNVRSKYGIRILATKQGNNIYPLPKPEHVFTDSESLMILGKNEDAVSYTHLDVYKRQEVDKSKLELHPALELKSHIAYIKSVGPGFTVSYGSTFTSKL